MQRLWDAIIGPLIEIAHPTSIVEIGSDDGGNTRNLLEYCLRSGARLHVIDPLPKYDVDEWQKRYGEHLVFHRDLSLKALPEIDSMDAVLIDGDHNWYTVFNELKLIEEQCEEPPRPFPLVMLHDIGWPYGRRDLYYDLDTIPEVHRRPYAKKGVHPDSEDLLETGGLNPHLCNAIRENEPKSGVLTAVEDFLAHTGRRIELYKVPGLHGLGLLVPAEFVERNAELAGFLRNLDLSETATRLIERIERGRIEMQISRQEHRMSLRRSQTRWRKREEELKTLLHDKEEQIASLLERLSQTQAEHEEVKEAANELRAQLQSREELVEKLTESLRHGEEEVRIWRERAVPADEQIEKLRRSFVIKDRKILVLGQKLEQRSREVDRMALWVEKMDAGISAILRSRQWKAGHALGRLKRLFTFRSIHPTTPDSLRHVSEGFRTWREKFDTDRKKFGAAQAAGIKLPEPQRQVSPQQPPAKPSEKPTTPSSHSSVATHFGAPEYVLETLRNLPPVTILIPVYNAHDDLKVCLESLVRNTNTPAELLLVNDASTDERIRPLLAEYEALEGVRVLTNEENLGFVRTVNRGFSESTGDVVLLNSDTEVTPRWLENLTLAAHTNPRTATVTAISDNAGAFSAPEIGKKNEIPEELSRDDTGRLVTQESGQVYPRTPTANGFCMYIKRAALDEVGHFDAENFPRGYGEENDFCMRAQKLGWNHIVDDATYVFHERQASFGEEKTEILKSGRQALDRLHPDYTLLARAFVASEDMKKTRDNVRKTFEAAKIKPVKPRILFVIHQSHGGTTFTNEDLMSAVSGDYEPYLLVSNVGQLKLYRQDPEDLVQLEQWNLRGNIEVTEYSRPDYRAIVFGIMARYRFELVHVRHLVGHTFDLPEIAARLRMPVILSFHDFYFSCPTVHLIDDHGKHCGGICTPGNGQCGLPTKRLQQFPRLKHAYLGTWREEVERMFEHVDAFVTTSNATKEIYLRSMPVLNSRPFRVIEHGRDMEQAHCATPPGEGPVKIVIPGSINTHKGAGFIRALKEVDTGDRLEFHFLGRVAAEWRDLGVMHGRYQREEFNDRVKEIAPSFAGIFSIWPETYCHTMTEAWAAGIPVLASDIGTLRERVNKHGGGWLLDLEDPEGAYRQILEIAADREEYERELARADLRGIKSVREMAEGYEELYGEVLRDRLWFSPPKGVSRSTR